MALLHRKVVRDAILACLDAGFNGAIAELAGTYNVPAFSLDFSDESQNVLTGTIEDQDVELSGLVDFPALTVDTNEVQDGSPRVVRGLQFSGSLIAQVDLLERRRDGREGRFAAARLEMAEDAVFSLFGAYTWPVSSTASIAYSRQASAQKGRLIELADGYAQRLSIQARFEVSIP
ncbi:MAG: hypothetical protein JWN34_2252 [Bryobacterales bacterium]|nr:hypothetical protein [Bryobacterales bacterium]